jgi:hypothetical protein
MTGRFTQQGDRQTAIARQIGIVREQRLSAGLAADFSDPVVRNAGVQP